MTILAIDPGPVHSALVMWDGEQITSPQKIINTEVLELIERGLVGDMIVCERVACYGMPVGKEVFDTVYWSGRYWQAGQRHAPFRLIERREVKLHLCGQARAKDSNIRQALVDRFGGKGTKAAPGLTYGLKADTWQAFALAVTCYDRPELLRMAPTTDGTENTERGGES